MTIELTPTQLAVVSHAYLHTDSALVWFPDNVKGGGRRKVTDALAARGLVDEVDSKWKLTELFHTTIGVHLARPVTALESVLKADEDADNNTQAAETAPAPDAELESAVATAEASWTTDASSTPRVRANTKQAQVIDMLRRAEGATIGQISAATGWQAHTVRGAFAGSFKKRLGLTIVSEKAEGGERVYRIV